MQHIQNIYYILMFPFNWQCRFCYESFKNPFMLPITSIECFIRKK